tara:strand:+ start:1049 stop:1507 length:459 start_codon:yes stop_codon:yes gene_type:complete
MSRPADKNPLATQHNTPEGKARHREMLLTRKNKGGRPLAVPDGYTKATIEPLRNKAKEDAKKAVAIMTDENENTHAKEALEAAVEILRTPGQTRDRLTAARLVLDFTKSKPVSKQEVTVGKAEAFLSSLLDEGDAEDDTEETETDEEAGASS